MGKPSLIPVKLYGESPLTLTGEITRHTHHLTHVA